MSFILLRLRSRTPGLGPPCRSQPLRGEHHRQHERRLSTCVRPGRERRRLAERVLASRTRRPAAPAGPSATRLAAVVFDTVTIATKHGLELQKGDRRGRGRRSVGSDARSTRTCRGHGHRGERVAEAKTARQPVVAGCLRQTASTETPSHSGAKKKKNESRDCTRTAVPAVRMFSTFRRHADGARRRSPSSHAATGCGVFLGACPAVSDRYAGTLVGGDAGGAREAVGGERAAHMSGVPAPPAAPSLSGGSCDLRQLALTPRVGWRGG